MKGYDHVYDALLSKYLVCKCGKIYNRESGREVKGSLHYGRNKKSPYLKCWLMTPSGNKVPVYKHRLVAYRYLSKNIKTKQVDHINRDGTDNRVENLRLVSARENAKNRGGIFS